MTEESRFSPWISSSIGRDVPDNTGGMAQTDRPGSPHFHDSEGVPHAEAMPGVCSCCRLVDDDAFGAAYDSVPAERRAWLKTSIAQLHTLYGMNNRGKTRCVTQWRQAFATEQTHTPVDWVLLVLPAQYAAAPRMLAALMPAFLAGVDDVLVVRLCEERFVPVESMNESAAAVNAHTGADADSWGTHAGIAAGGCTPVCTNICTNICIDAWQPEILAALELAGQELVADMTRARICTMLDSLATGKHGTGRCLFLGNALQTVGMSAELASSSPLRVWSEPTCTTLAVEDAAALDTAVLAWAHPDWEQVALSTLTNFSGERRVYAAVVADPVSSRHVTEQANIPLVLGAGQEGCWIWPELSPAFFRHQRLHVFGDA